jgi:hypothetical protein
VILKLPICLYFFPSLRPICGTPRKPGPAPRYEITSQREHQWVAVSENRLARSLAITAGLVAIQRSEAAGNIAVWDTGSRLANLSDAENRTPGNPCPADLFALEAEPLKAASDPGYYGLEYSFKGDAVVENRNLVAVFSSARGRVAIYSKAAAQDNTGLGKRSWNSLRCKQRPQPVTISRCEILHNAGDEVVVEFSFPSKGPRTMSAVLSFGKMRSWRSSPPRK